MYKTVSEVLAALSQEPNPAIVETNYDGKKYISWDNSVRELDRIFGPFGWSERAIAMEAHPAEGIYTAAVEVSVTVKADKGDATFTITRAGYGRSTAQASKDERAQGLTVAQNLQTHDTAASAAGSDALSKAVKKLGQAFGLGFYGEAKRERAAGNGAPQRSSYSGGGSRPPSEAQMRFLSSLGYTADDVDGMPFGTWKAILDNKTQKPGTTPRPRPGRAAVAEREPDDIPF